MRRLVPRLALGVALAVTTACDQEQAARDRARREEQALREGAAEIVRREQARAAAHAGEVADQVMAVKRQLTAATEAGRKVKAELDKVYKTSRDYDLLVAETGAADPDAAAHAARLATMPHVTIGGAKVGYEEDATRSVRGVSYAKHFRASWQRGDDTVHVSYLSKEEYDLVAFAALLERLVPIVERELR